MPRSVKSVNKSTACVVRGIHRCKLPVYGVYVYSLHKCTVPAQEEKLPLNHTASSQHNPDIHVPHTMYAADLLTHFHS